MTRYAEKENKKSNERTWDSSNWGSIFSQTSSARPIGFHFDDALRMSSVGIIFFPEPAATFVGFAFSRWSNVVVEVSFTWIFLPSVVVVALTTLLFASVFSLMSLNAATSFSSIDNTFGPSMPLGLLVRPSLHISGDRVGEPLALAFSALPPELLETGRNFVKSEVWVLVMMTTSSS